jgi:hypothetical protein
LIAIKKGSLKNVLKKEGRKNAVFKLPFDLISLYLALLRLPYA